jgi:hypothetical protein
LEAADELLGREPDDLLPGGGRQFLQGNSTLLLLKSDQAAVRNRDPVL